MTNEEQVKKFFPLSMLDMYKVSHQDRYRMFSSDTDSIMPMLPSDKQVLFSILRSLVK